MYIEAECPACETEIIHEVNILNANRDGNIDVSNSWETRTFVTQKVNQILLALPLKINDIKETLSSEGFENLSDKIIDDIKLAGAYEEKGKLLPA